MRLEKVKIPRVWADEYFYESEIIPVTGIVPPLGVTLTPDTIITGDATVAVASCTFIGLGLVQVEYIVQEELTVETPGEDSFPLEYTFRFTALSVPEVLCARRRSPDSCTVRSSVLSGL